MYIILNTRYENKSERVVSAMSKYEFKSRFSNEKATIDWFVPIVEQVSAFTGKEKGSKVSIVLIVTTHSHRLQEL
jgi:hypothetical protein